ENSPAQAAGVKEMDLVIGINDENVYNMNDLTTILSKYKPGDTIQLKIVRDEKNEMVIPVVLGNKGNQK
ncbi:MAG TPA: PDZ domain-containing protein, partial [Fusibacter sp.]|nr:PDZ domain-containing protein [Fusibacter sp.]